MIKILIIILSIIAVLDVLILWACCKVASEADKYAQMYYNSMKSVNNKNNIKNEGE